MTHRSMAASAAGTDPASPPSGYDAPARTHGWRQFSALSLAAGTFLGLGALVGPVGAANAEPDPAVVEVIDAFANGGTLTLGADVEVDQTLTLASGKTLVIDLAGHSLTVRGGTGSAGATGVDGTDPNGQPGNPGEDAITNSGNLIVLNTSDGGYLVATGGNGGAGGTGGMGAAGVSGVNDGKGATGGRGGKGGAGGDGLVNTEGARLFLLGNVFNLSGGNGGNGGNVGAGGAGADLGDGIFGAKGDYGTGGDGGEGGSALVNNDGRVATSSGFGESLQLGIGGKGSGGFGQKAQDGEAFDGDQAKVTLESNGGSAPTEFTVYMAIGIPVSSAIAMMSGSPLAWPARDGHTLDSWSDVAVGGAAFPTGTAVDGDGSPYTLYAQWKAAESGGSGNGDDGGNGNTGGNSSQEQNTAPATSTSTPAATSKPAAPSTTVSTTKPPATTSPKPSATAPSIPTNNVTNPETFVSSQAPAPQPLPGISQVDDTSASQFDVDTHTPTQGGDLTLTARGFKPGTVVDFWMHSTPVYLGSAIADIHGIAVLPVTLTPTLVGSHHVQSIGTGLKGEPRNLAQPITIAAAPTAPALASTGVATAPLVFLAVLLLAAGAAILLADRRRTDRAAADGTPGGTAGSHR